jgi:hypothetical protein
MSRIAVIRPLAPSRPSSYTTRERSDGEEDEMSHHIRGEAKKAATKKPAKKGSKKK